MSARLAARLGQGAEARSVLVQLQPLEQWPHRALPVEFHAVSALAWLADRNQDEALREIDAAMQVLEALREEYRLHEERGWGEPSEVHPRTLQMAILDMAAILAAIGKPDRAVNELTKLSGLDGWEYDYIANDPLLAPLRADLRCRRLLLRWQTANT
jgi:hypothetical protein